MNEEELINYFQEKINNGNHKIFTDISDASYKTIDAINCIIGLQQENKQLKEQLKQRDEVIDELKSNILRDIDGFETINEFGGCNDILDVLYVYKEILQKYKGDNK